MAVSSISNAKRLDVDRTFGAVWRGIAGGCYRGLCLLPKQGAWYGLRGPVFAQRDADNPSLSIWIGPRATMRYILTTDPESFVFGLCFIGALTEGLRRAAGRSARDSIPFPFILLISAAFSIFGARFMLEIGGRLLRWSSGLLDGQVTLQDVQATLSRSNVPSLISLLLWLPLLILVGPDMSTTAAPRVDEAHQFSSWRALGASIIAWLPFLVVAIRSVVGIIGLTLLSGRVAPSC